MSKKVLIAGIGLIGGSLALAIKKTHPSYQVLAFDSNQESLKQAQDLQMIDGFIGKNELASELASFDYIILALPVEKSIDLLEFISQFDLKPGLIITDVSSTKALIVKRAEDLFAGRDVSFVGGHPMAGSHKSGVLAANLSLFENAYYVLSKSQVSKDADLDKIKSLLAGSGATFIELSASEHDQVTSQLSHFPHVLAAMLVRQSKNYAKDHPATEFLAAGGFRDMTRIASSDAQMWTDILMTNKEYVAERINDFAGLLGDLKDSILAGDQLALYEFFDGAREQRKSMQIHNGAIPNFYDLYVNVPDKTGVIHEILGYLTDAGISIINIRIIENREEIMGGLKLSFRSSKDLDKAQTIIEEKTGYKVYET
ncbi:prephenate dehydrogenase [Streptococcaceae bacterium ESL0687]|nr:prephenate dehydrogenase [Streptococcaceae bacterium ESL0687]